MKIGASIFLVSAFALFALSALAAGQEAGSDQEGVMALATVPAKEAENATIRDREAKCLAEQEQGTDKLLAQVSKERNPAAGAKQAPKKFPPRTKARTTMLILGILLKE